MVDRRHPCQRGHVGAFYRKNRFGAKSGRRRRTQWKDQAEGVGWKAGLLAGIFDRSREFIGLNGATGITRVLDMAKRGRKMSWGNKWHSNSSCEQQACGYFSTYMYSAN